MKFIVGDRFTVSVPNVGDVEFYPVTYTDTGERVLFRTYEAAREAAKRHNEMRGANV